MDSGAPGAAWLAASAAASGGAVARHDTSDSPAHPSIAIVIQEASGRTPL
jgi:hypothetical protein